MYTFEISSKQKKPEERRKRKKEQKTLVGTAIVDKGW